MLRIRTVEAPPPGWDAFVSSSPQGTLFHLSQWAGAVQRAYGHLAYFLAAEADGEIAGVLPLVHLRSWLFGRALVSLPFVDYGGVCARDAQAASRLIEAAAGMARRAGVSYVELRKAGPTTPTLAASQEKVSMTLALPPTAEELWRSLPLERRSRIQKARRTLTTSIHGGEAATVFYRVFAANMRDLGSPVHSLGFFQEIARALPENTRIVLVSHDGLPVGAGFCLGFKDRFMVPWSSSLREYFKLYPNFLLFWAALEHACSHGYRTFDFGRSTMGSGTYEFKRGWRAQATPLNWEYLLLNGQGTPSPESQKGRFGLLITAWKRLPLPLANRLGPLIRKHISL